MRFAGVVLLSLACLTGGPGCSLLYAKGPPKRPAPHQPVRCTTTYNLSIVDALIAALDVAVLYMLTKPDAGPGSVRAGPTGVTLGIGLAGLFTMSAAVGAARVGQCRELLSAMARAQEEEADEDEEEDEDDVAEQAKAPGKATRASPLNQAPPPVTPQVAPDQ